MRFHDGIEKHNGELWVGGIRLEDLAAQYGTPLYIYDETSIRAVCRNAMAAAREYPGDFSFFYASKAFPNVAVERVIASEGLGVDVASEGELRVALRAGVSAKNIVLHGVYKPNETLNLAIESGVGRIVIDSIADLERVEHIAAAHGKIIHVLLRVNPGIKGDTKEPVTTAGNSKFGIPLLGGHLFETLRTASTCRHLRVEGLHCHVGSLVFASSIFEKAAEFLLTAMKVAQADGIQLTELNLGGGFGTFYRDEFTPVTRELGSIVRTIIQTVREHCAVLDLPLPHLAIEPGRGLVAEAAVAVYTIAAVKEVPWFDTKAMPSIDTHGALVADSMASLRTTNYIVIDGGLFENPRPLFYGSVYDAVLPQRIDDPPQHSYTISGSSCETDQLIEEIHLPQVHAGDLLAMPSAGAYQVAMSGNFQRMPKPAVVMVNKGVARVIQRRQTIEEVLALDSTE